MTGLLAKFQAAFRRRPIGFSKQIMLILVSLSIICTGLMGLIGYTITNKLNKELVLSSLQAQTDGTYKLIDSVVNTSIGNYLGAIAETNKEIIESYYTRFKSGEIAEDAAKNEVEKILLAERVGQTGYIYVVDSKGLLKVHPYLKNTDLSAFAFIKTQIIKKQGYLEYSWKNPTDSEEKKKALYMTYFKPWDYIISVSSYKTEFVNLVNTQDFESDMLSTVIGETGYMFIMDSTGKLIIHPKQEGISIYDSVDSQGNFFISSRPTKHYTWQNNQVETALFLLYAAKYLDKMTMDPATVNFRSYENRSIFSK